MGGDGQFAQAMAGIFEHGGAAVVTVRHVAQQARMCRSAMFFSSAMQARTCSTPYLSSSSSKCRSPTLQAPYWALRSPS
jgi:hypothetical protein